MWNPQSQNGYAYVHNNPLKYTDPSGFAVAPTIDIDLSGYKYKHALSGLVDAIEYARNDYVNNGNEYWQVRSHIGTLFKNGRIIPGDTSYWGNKPEDNNQFRYLFDLATLSSPYENSAGNASWATHQLLGYMDSWIEEKKVEFLWSALLALPIHGKFVPGGTGKLENLLKQKSVGNGSTGRTIPNNLQEQLSMKEVLSNPLEGATQVPVKNMNDSRWLGSEGWVKMQRVVEHSEGNSTIHFNYNTITGLFDDFKFK